MRYTSLLTGKPISRAERPNIKLPKEVEVLQDTLPQHLKPPEIFLGAGGQGIVLGMHHTAQNDIKAVKEILIPDQRHLDTDLTGILISQRLRTNKFLAPEEVYYADRPLNLHSNVWDDLSMDQQEQFGFRQEHAQGALYVVMPAKRGECLFDFIDQGYCFHPDGSYKGLVAELLLIELVVMLRELARHQVCHVDLKPENLALTSDSDRQEFRLELFDFGHATPFGLRCPIGTPMFTAPEIVRNRGAPATQGVDMFAAGVTLYSAVLGDLHAHPYGLTYELCESRERVLDQLERVREPYIPNHLPFRWRTILKGMLHQDPRKRWTVPQLAALVHPKVLEMVMDAPQGQDMEGLLWIQAQHQEYYG